MCPGELPLHNESRLESKQTHAAVGIQPRHMCAFVHSQRCPFASSAFVTSSQNVTRTRPCFPRELITNSLPKFRTDWPNAAPGDPRGSDNTHSLDAHGIAARSQFGCNQPTSYAHRVRGGGEQLPPLRVAEEFVSGLRSL